MSWRAIQEADLLEQISGDELEAIRAAALGEHQEDPVLTTLDQVALEVRGYVAACAKNQLHAKKNFIPGELIGHAVAIAVPRLCSRVAGLAIDKDKVRHNAAERAHSVLRDVAACRFVLEQPAQVTTANMASGSVELVSGPTRVTSRDKLDGLL